MHWKEIGLLIGCLASLSGCLPTNQTEPDAAALEAFIERSKAQMVFVEGGTFLMGDQPSERGLYHTMENDNKPAVEVTLDSFSIGAYEISYEEVDFYTDFHGLPKFIDQPYYRDQYWRAPEYPAGISWTGAKNYCLWLAELTGLPFDLPTEAQWEYAARNRGEFVVFATDDGTINRGINYSEYTPHPKPSGTYPPNPLGLYDMSGNMIEWVNDWYDADYYQYGPGENPRGPDAGTQKVMRGGSFGESPSASNVFLRFKEPDQDKAYSAAGFRCAVHSTSPVR